MLKCLDLMFALLKYGTNTRQQTTSKTCEIDKRHLREDPTTATPYMSVLSSAPFGYCTVETQNLHSSLIKQDE